MTALLEWLLGLERISLSSGRLSIELAQPPAAWVMLAGAVLVVLLVSFVYRFEHGNRGLRLFLAAVRACVLMMVLGLLSRPNLVLRRENVDPSVVAVLVDSSASMNLADAPASQPTAHTTRYQQAIDALQTGALAELRKRHRVELWTFADVAHRENRKATDETLTLLAATQPTGRQTDLGEALSDVLDKTQGARLSAVVVLSDGRQTLASGSDRAIDEARQRMTPVYAATLGSEQGVIDVQVESVMTDSTVFLKDIASVRARLSLSGANAPTDVNVRLIDTATGQELDRRAVRIGGASASHESADNSPTAANVEPTSTGEVELRFRPQRAGMITVRVEADSTPGELEPGNNSGEAAMQVLDQKLRVLYVEGPPRFEYRFLKNTLLREATVTSSCLLLDATASFVQEGSEPIRAFPISPGELGAYDVVLLGDVDPHDDWLSPAQMAMLIDFVAVRGGGLGFIAGQRAMPQRVRGTPLEKLLPVRIDPDAGRRAEAAAQESFHMLATADGRRSGLLRFEVDPEQNDATIAALGGWYWTARVLGRKPGTEVLAVHPTETCADGPLPVIAAGRYGAGRTLFIGSDDVWRWRRYQGEGFYDAFWMNALRLLGGERRLGAARVWRLESDRRSYEVGQRVSFRLTARDREAAAGLAAVDLRVSRGENETIANIRLDRATGEAAAFEGSYWPDRAGALTATALPAGVSVDSPVRTINVRTADAERRRPQSDPAFLQALTSRTGGRCVKPEELMNLARTIPDRSVRTADDVVEPLWDTRLVLLIFVVLLTTEWAARKLKGLA